MHHPTDRIKHTTAFVTPVMEHWLEREIAQWVHSMKERSDDPSHHERTLLPRLMTIDSIFVNWLNTVSILDEPCTGSQNVTFLSIYFVIGVIRYS